MTLAEDKWNTALISERIVQDFATSRALIVDPNPSEEWKMAKPRLTKKVRKGLLTMAGVVESGSSADLLGYDLEQMDPALKREWECVETACIWIRRVCRWFDEKNNERRN